jgi:tRNA threonylcarbamoyladenosine biosynthesis protein TsaB
MTILGIETSSAVCSVGLANDSGAFAERSLVESHIHSEKLLTLIQGICDDQKIKLSQLDALAISIGPGSFTGLRIGLSTAKGLCYSLGLLLITVPAFEAVAEAVFSARPGLKRLLIGVDAKQGEYYYGIYENLKGTLCDVHPVAVEKLPIALGFASEETVIVTDRTDAVKKIFDKAGVIEDFLSYCRGDRVASLAIRKLKSGGKNASDNLEPMYLKDFVIQKKVEVQKLN